MNPALYKLFLDMEEEGKFPCSFYKANAILILTLDKFSTRQKVQADFSYTCKKLTNWIY